MVYRRLYSEKITYSLSGKIKLKTITHADFTLATGEKCHPIHIHILSDRNFTILNKKWRNNASGMEDSCAMVRPTCPYKRNSFSSSWYCDFPHWSYDTFCKSCLIFISMRVFCSRMKKPICCFSSVWGWVVSRNSNKSAIKLSYERSTTGCCYLPLYFFF